MGVKGEREMNIDIYLFGNPEPWASFPADAAKKHLKAILSREEDSAEAIVFSDFTPDVIVKMNEFDTFGYHPAFTAWFKQNGDAWTLWQREDVPYALQYIGGLFELTELEEPVEVLELGEINF
jgi:hypothetical protein